MKDYNLKILTSPHYDSSFLDALRGKRITADDRRYLNEAAISTAPLTMAATLDMQAQFGTVRKKHGIMRRLCRTVSTTQGDNAIWATVRTSGATWMAPADPYPDAAEAVTTYKSNPRKLGCNVVLAEDLARDTRFDIVGALADIVGRRFALGEDTGIISGSGDNGELSGLINQATAVDVAALDYAALKSIYYSVPSFYRSNATWVVSDATAEAIRGLLDNAGRPLLDIANGLTLFGRPVEVCAGCADNLVLFGDMSTVWLLDRSPLFVVPLSELYATAQEMGYHCWALLDCVAVRPEAVAVATVSAT